MKKLICLLLVILTTFSLSACSNQEELVDDVNTDNVIGDDNGEDEQSSEDAENIDEDNYIADMEYINEDEEPYYTMTLMNHDGDLLDVEYRESGISYYFNGGNSYQNGYAFIIGSDTMYGEAVFFENGIGESESETLYIYRDGHEGVYVSKTAENYRETGEYYMISSQSTEEIMAEFYGDDGETQYWRAIDTIIYSIDKEEKIVPESTYVTMTTTNEGGAIKLNIQGNGEWIFDNHTAVLGDLNEFGGFYSGWELYVYPEYNTVNVNIRYTDTEYYDMRSVVVTFVKREEGDNIYSHVEFDESSAPITFADKEMERLLAEHLNVPVGEIKKEHMELVEVIVIGGNSLYKYATDEVYFEYSVIGSQEMGSITTLEDLKYCTNLKEIYIGNNQISDISALSELTDLKVINFTINQISDISALKNLTNLEKLTLDHNNVSSAADLTGLKNLKLLNLGSNNNNTFSDIESIAQITSLESLTLYNNECSDITSLANLTDLTFLSVSTNGITDVSALENLTNLQKLFLGQNYDLTDVSALNNLENLQYLSLKKTGVSNTNQIPNLVENYTSIEFE